MTKTDWYRLPARLDDELATEDAWTRLTGSVGARRPARGRSAKVAAATIAALAGAAAYVHARSRQADRDRPPQGRFVEVDGVRLHYAEQGDGPAVVLLHGNGSMIDEMLSSGLVALVSQHYRVIVFDRPGFGDSERPSGRRWTSQAQASLIAQAMRRLGIGTATVVGHSWGTLVALALALDHPGLVRGLVLVSGYYFPTFRPDAFLLSAPAWPGLGAVMSRTTSPLLGRLLWRALVRIAFGPPATPDAFAQLPAWRFLRPSRVRASAEESGMLVSEAAALSRRYGEIGMPTVILAGEQDRVVSVHRHAERLHRAIAGSTLHSLPGVGHMLHHIAPERVLRAIGDVALQDARRGLPSDDHPLALLRVRMEAASVGGDARNG